jgi:hypothetical protein
MVKWDLYMSRHAVESLPSSRNPQWAADATTDDMVTRLTASNVEVVVDERDNQARPSALLQMRRPS